MMILIDKIRAAADLRRLMTGARQMKYRVLIEQDEDGVFVVEVPSLPGCVMQGKTRDEALRNAQVVMASRNGTFAAG